MQVPLLITMPIMPSKAKKKKKENAKGSMIQDERQRCYGPPSGRLESRLGL